MLSVSQASQYLEVSDRRVRALIASGRLQAERVGRSWVIHPNQLAAASRSRPNGRPISAVSAWQELLAAEHQTITPDKLKSRYRNRSKKLVCDCPNIDQAIADPRCAIGNWMAVNHHDSLVDNTAQSSMTVYLRSTEIDDWMATHRVIEFPAGRLRVHSVSSAAADIAHDMWAGDRFVAPRVAAVDLAEEGAPRSIDIAIRLWAK